MGDPNEVLVAAENNVAKVSLIQQHQSKIFSRKEAGNFQLPPITGLTFSPIRHFDWPAVVTIHRDCSYGMVWSAHLQSLVPKRLERRDAPDVFVTAAQVS